MTEVQEATEPVVIEYGRYRLLRFEDGTSGFYRARQTCQTCQDCGCGEQLEPVGPIPAAMTKMMCGEQITMSDRLGLVAQLAPLMKGMMGLGNGSA